MNRTGLVIALTIGVVIGIVFGVMPRLDLAVSRAVLRPEDARFSAQRACVDAVLPAMRRVC